MEYIQWLEKQEYESSLKNMAKDIQMDYSFPHGKGFDEMLEYFKQSDVDPRIIYLFTWSYSVYLVELRKRVEQLEEEFIREIEEN
ncbi:YozE SAM-like fold [Alkalibacterium gilvum]|uniref:YozE SAM-like fold n=1 Tax=Alkalibacterium gilvum TaxID=1130080 RepID=A0A1H6RWV4_9LACT|nr:YozE family protein [Alkalibacterium gilvum]SEI58936.1 YozE SAM-like fold [Alkalibacterium gilvum]